MISDLITAQSALRLDIGCGANKQPNFTGLDVRPLPGVDIVWNVTHFPWPLPDESVILAMCSHLVEHIPPMATDPKLMALAALLMDRGVVSRAEVHHYLGDIFDETPTFIRFMNEVWRILKPNGEFMISCPYGFSVGQFQDPTHCNPVNEKTWAYFDPAQLSGLLYNIYRPKPWAIKFIDWDPSVNMEIVLVKRRCDE